MVWVTLCQLKTGHGYFNQERTRKTRQWKFIPCLEAFSSFQSVADASHASLIMKSLHGIFWSLFSLFWMFLKLRTSENEVPKSVRLHLYLQPMGFSTRKSKHICSSSVVSAHFCNSHLRPPPSEGWVVNSGPEGIWEDFRLSVFATSICTCAELCLCWVLKKQINSPHTLKITLAGIGI